MARRRIKPDEPLEIFVSFTVRTGKGPEHCHQILDHQRVPMVGTVFDNRDRMMRFLAVNMVKIAALQTEVARSLMPVIRNFRG